MAARGSIAKEKVAKKLAEAFGNDWIGEYDRKYYVWSEENGERVQIAISMTCPKSAVGAASASKEDVLDFTGDASSSIGGGNVNVEITADEKKNIADLMARLGL